MAAACRADPNRGLDALGGKRVNRKRRLARLDDTAPYELIIGGTRCIAYVDFADASARHNKREATLTRQSAVEGLETRVIQTIYRFRLANVFPETSAFDKNRCIEQTVW